MFLVVRSNDSFNFPLGLIKYIVIVTCVASYLSNQSLEEFRTLFDCLHYRQPVQRQCVRPGLRHGFRGGTAEGGQGRGGHVRRAGRAEWRGHHSLGGR